MSELVTFSYYVAEQVCRAEQLFDRGRRSRTDFLSNGDAPAEPFPHFGFAAPAIIRLFAAAAGSAHHTRTAALRACVLAPRRSRRLRAAWSFKRCCWRCRGRHVALNFSGCWPLIASASGTAAAGPLRSALVTAAHRWVRGLSAWWRRLSLQALCGRTLDAWLWVLPCCEPPSWLLVVELGCCLDALAPLCSARDAAPATTLALTPLLLLLLSLFWTRWTWRWI